MRNAEMRALAALLCLTTLAALSGCMSAELVAGRLTETVLPLPTPTAEAAPTIAPTQNTSLDLSTPAPSPAGSSSSAATPTAAPSDSVQSSATASPPPAPTTSPKRPSREEALEILGGPRLNEDEEIASLCAEWGVQDERIGPGATILMKDEGNGCWSAEIWLRYGAFFVRYDENLRRTSGFYLRDEEFMGYKIGNITSLEGENWEVVLLDVPREEAPEDFPLIAGFDESDLGDTVNLLCLLSDDGEVLGGYVAPAEWIAMLSETDVTFVDPGKGSLVVDLETNTVCTNPRSLKRRFADGSYVDYAGRLDEKDEPEEIQFYRADGTVYRTMQPEEFYDRFDAELAARSRDGYTFSLIALHYIQFVSPTECHILFYPYVEYNGEYVPRSDDLCLLTVEV